MAATRPGQHCCSAVQLPPHPSVRDQQPSDAAFWHLLGGHLEMLQSASWTTPSRHCYSEAPDMCLCTALLASVTSQTDTQTYQEGKGAPAPHYPTKHLHPMLQCGRARWVVTQGCCRSQPGRHLADTATLQNAMHTYTLQYVLCWRLN